MGSPLRPLNAAEHLSHAMHLSPRDPHISRDALTGLGRAKMMAGEYEEALRFERQTLQEMPRNAVAHKIVAASLALLGRKDEAYSAMHALLPITSITPAVTRSGVREADNGIGKPGAPRAKRAAGRRRTTPA